MHQWDNKKFSYQLLQRRQKRDGISTRKINIQLWIYMGKTMGIRHQLVVCIVDLAPARKTFATEGLPDASSLYS